MKVLIVSHNPLSTYQNMGKTMMSLFSEFKKEELCQLYIYPTVPNADMCGSYYRITDKDVLRFYGSFRVKGKEIIPDASFHQMFENSGDEKIYRTPKNQKSSRILLRDMMWTFARWYSKDLENWLIREAPTVIWVAPGISGFLYDIVEKISKKFSLPVVTYICDDYYFTTPPREMFSRIRCVRLRGKIEKLMQKSAQAIVICPELKETYERHFSVPLNVVMTGSSMPAAEGRSLKETFGCISYFGNIRCNRYISLADVGKALDAINEEKNTSCRLRIYTDEKNREILSVFDGIQSIELCAFVVGDALERAMSEADYLLHVEAFDEASIERVRYSVSTKIADSLASGIPLIAYAPPQVASMQHLIRGACALTVLDPSELKTALSEVLEDGQPGELAVQNALAVALKDHNTEHNSQRMKAILCQAEGSSSL